MSPGFSARSIILGLLGFVVLIVCAAVAQERPDYSKLKASLSGNVPHVVDEFPFSALPITTRPFFDYFMWQNFIALMWPSRPQDHGEPYRPDDPSIFRAGYDGSQNLIPAWLGWMTAYELYPQDGSTPSPWGQHSTWTPCRGVSPADSRPELIQITKFTTPVDEFNQAFGGPLFDQTGLLTRYEVRFNRAEYDYVRDNGLYNQSNWPAPGGAKPPIFFPASSPGRLGAIEIKTAWRDLSKLDPKWHNRFYTERALVVEPDTCTKTPSGRIQNCTCDEMTVGLVGFHIAHKTAQFPQWVWSTFEQVDNLGEDSPPGMPPSYYNGARANPADHPGYSYQPDEIQVEQQLHTARLANANVQTAGKPVNVARLSAIPGTPTPDNPKDPSLGPFPTTTVNDTFRKLVKGTIWENYWLIGTQWSTAPSYPPQTPLRAPYLPMNKPSQDFGCEDGTAPAQGGLAFPECQVANITMETYHQYDSCQNCHAGAQRINGEYSWTLVQRAFNGKGSLTRKATQ
jgi:hypothetical protein